MHSKFNLGFVFLFLSIISSKGLLAQNLDGYLGLGYNFHSHLNASETGTRKSIDLEFGRLSKNVALDLGLGSGLGYNDFGLTFRVFQTFYIPANESQFLVTVGTALLGQKATQDVNLTLADGSVAGRRFWDIGIALPQVRAVFDTKVGVAFALNLGFDLVFMRKFTDTASPTSTSEFRKRFTWGLSLMTSSRWLE